MRIFTKRAVTDQLNCLRDSVYMHGMSDAAMNDEETNGVLDLLDKLVDIVQDIQVAPEQD